jgi:tetratricopeptide (TPR) repeat protein
VNLDPSIILYEIYQLIENGIIIPSNLETVASDIELKQEAKSEKMTKYKSISSIIIDNSQIEELHIEEMNEDSARNLIKKAVKKGKNAEKTLAYQVAAKEFKKALFLAREFNLKTDISKISQILLDLENKEKQLELEFVMKAGDNAEKNGDYINSINNYQKALKILEGFLIFNISDSRIKKLKKKIIKMRAEI